jgi:phosphinothricin acetyltransferase
MSAVAARPAAATLRDATLDDAPVIAAIYAGHVLHGTASFELAPPTVDEMRQRMDALLRGGFPFVAACRDGALVGYAYAGPYRPRPAYRYTVEDSIYLAPEAQRQGIGSALLDRLVERCVARGDRQMIAAIGDSANGGSIAVHARAGFVEIGRLDKVGRKFERWLDVVFMQRALGDGASSAPVDRAP